MKKKKRRKDWELKVLLLKNWRGDRDFIQADSLVSEMVLTAEPMLTSQVQDQDGSR